MITSSWLSLAIFLASLEFLKIKSLSDIPSGDDLPNAWMNSAEYRQKVLADVCDGVVDQFISFSFNENGKIHRDKVYNYSMHLLSLGSFYLEYVDATKEGDGQRVLRCWKHISQSSGHTNYSIEVMNILCQCKFKLAPRQSAELLYNHFVNVHGLPGMNIPADLHQEYLNRVCKDVVFGLGANKTEKSIGQVVLINMTM